jgi:hypothetical protein
MLAAKRMREHAALFASVAGVTAILAGLGSGLLGYLAAALDNGVRTAIQSSAGESGALRITLDLTDDPDDQDRRMRALLAEVFDSGGRLPLEVIRTESIGQGVELVRPGAEEPEDPDAEPITTAVVTIPDLETTAALVDGDWARAVDELTMQADAAAALDLSPGDRVILGGTDFRLTGVWRVVDALDPRWFGDPLVSSGLSALGEYGPVAIDAASWDELCIEVSGTCGRHDAEWTLIPADDFGSADLAAVVRGAEELRDALGAEFETMARVEGQLADTATVLSSRVDAVRSVVPVALLLFAAIGLVTLAGLARLLTSVRADEVTLMRSRGASVGRLVGTTALESVVIAGLGAAVGAGAATGVLLLITGDDGVARALGPWAIAIPVTVALVAVVLITGVAWRATRQALRRDSLNETGRGRTVVGASLVALLTIAAAVSVSQFLLYGSPLSPAPGGGTQIDPVAVLAPALALVAVVLLALLAFPPLARVVALISARDPGIRGSLSARSVARRAQLVATPIVLVGLACGQLVVAAAYSATWAASATQTLEARLGAPVVIQGPPGTLTDDVTDRITATPGVGPIAPVLRSEADFSDATIAVVAAAEGALAEISTDVGGLFPRTALADAPSTESPGPVLPAGAIGVRLETSPFGVDDAPELSVMLMDRLGNLVPVALDLESTGDADEAAPIWTYAGALDDERQDGGPWRILSIDVDLPLAESTQSIQFTVTSISATDGAGDDLDLGLRWSTSADEESFVRPPLVTPFRPGLRAALQPGDGGVVHLVPISDPATGLLQIPIVVTEELAADYNLAPGRILVLKLPFGRGQVAATVVDVVPAIPGATNEYGVLLDLAWVRLVQIRDTGEAAVPETLWANPHDPSAVLSDLRETLPADTRLSSLSGDPVQNMLGVAAVIVWLGAAGTSLLALIAIATVAGALLRSRASDVVLLRALGLSGRSQARMRRSELAWIATFGLVVGVLSGAVVSFLTVGLLARAAVPDPFANLPTVLRVDPLVLAAAVVALAIGIAVVLIAYGIRIAAQARTLSMREELR